jgi:hypothetical protein
LRLGRIFLYLFVLGGLIWYGVKHHPGVTLSMCLAEPMRYDGAIIDVGNEAVVQSVAETTFTIHYLNRTVQVEGSLPESRVGQYIYLKARFVAPDRLEAIAIRIAERRRSKIILSIFPAVIILFWFFRRFRLNLSAMIFEER